MKILLTRKPTDDGEHISEIKMADEYTIAHEPIASIYLMERASRMFVICFNQLFAAEYKKVVVLCGTGDNGGDGLAIARMLYRLSYDVEVVIVEGAGRRSANFEANLVRLENLITPVYINSETEDPLFYAQHLYIDALLGAGLSRPLSGLIKDIVDNLNAVNAEMVAVDIATGLFADTPNAPGDSILRVTHTISFQMPKLAFMLPQNEAYTGDWSVMNIGLNESYINSIDTRYEYTDAEAAQKLLRPRSKFANKGSFGHALMIASSYGMVGAAVLSARACLRSGVGKLSVLAPRCGYVVLQTTVAEAMCVGTANDDFLQDLPAIDGYQAIGIGCGLGTRPETAAMILALLQQTTAPLVIDADALNILSAHPEWLPLLPAGTVLTPHPKEFQRLLGKQWTDDYEKLDLLSAFAVQYQCVVCLKGAHTAVALPDGRIHFNSTGNAGMAKGGSGDVLTGVILALLAQGYTPAQAAILGVYQHGLAGDKAAETKGATAMIASDIIDCIRF